MFVLISWFTDYDNSRHKYCIFVWRQGRECSERTTVQIFTFFFPQESLGVIHAVSQYCVYMAFRTMLVLSIVLYLFFQLHFIVYVLIYLVMVLRHISKKGSLWTSWIMY